MRISEVMTENVRTVPPTMSALHAWSMMRSAHIHHLVVTRGKKVVGLLSERDIAPKRSEPRIPESVTVEDLMSTPVATLEQGQSVRKAATFMKGRSLGCLPVMDNGTLVGIVTMADVLDLLVTGGDRPAKKPRATISHLVKHGKQALPSGLW
jgi:acetoin utilization protein AcuB